MFHSGRIQESTRYQRGRLGAPDYADSCKFVLRFIKHWNPGIWWTRRGNQENVLWLCSWCLPPNFSNYLEFLEKKTITKMCIKSLEVNNQSIIIPSYSSHCCTIPCKLKSTEYKATTVIIKKREPKTPIFLSHNFNYCARHSWGN